jgi:hypothetical protein
MKILLERLVNESDLNQRDKMISMGFINRAQDSLDRAQEIRTIVESFTTNRFDIVLHSDEVIIYKIESKDEWDIKYPYRVVYKDVSNNWERVSTVSPTMDVAYLNYLTLKYLGNNSQFAYFAIKMLDIEIKY